jgi:hypothetical protein
VSEDGVFVVGIDPAVVLHRREIVRRVQRRGAWVTLGIGVAGIVAALYALIAFRGAGLWPFALLLIAAMTPLVVSTVLVLRSMPSGSAGTTPTACNRSPCGCPREHSSWLAKERRTRSCCRGRR